MASKRSTSWLAPLNTAHCPMLRLLCLPFAGGGTAPYRAFSSHVAPHCELLALRLPGRESRYSEPLATSLDEVVQSTLAELRLLPTVPLVVFGHSMGTLIAYELGLALEAAGMPPLRVVVSARCAPHCAPHRQAVHDLSDERLVEELRALGGTPEEFLRSRELQELLLPMLRADFRLSETYRRADPQPLACELVALAGTQDAHASARDVSKWGEVAGGGFALHSCEGGHFFLFDDPAATLGLILKGL